jgi:hypothetical protein
VLEFVARLMKAWTGMPATLSRLRLKLRVGPVLQNVSVLVLACKAFPCESIRIGLLAESVRGWILEAQVPQGNRLVQAPR